MEKQIAIYQGIDGQTEIEVTFEQDTVWLTQEQIKELFQRDRTVVTKHIGNVFKEKELDEKSNVQILHIAGSDRPVKFYSLDVIISVGYRVKSPQGTKFRQWATQRLKDYLIQGYAINESRLAQKQQEIQTLKDGIRILSRAIESTSNDLSPNWLSHFSKGLTLLDDYDHERLDENGLSKHEALYPALEEYQDVINSMKNDFDSAIFGREKDKGFQSAVAQIAQGIGNQDLYPSIEEKAATLLYLIVKNHAFVDGNKRIAAACFLLFLKENNILHDKSGTPIISNEALASLTLFIASSKADEMDTVKKLTISVLNRNQRQN